MSADVWTLPDGTQVPIIRQPAPRPTLMARIRKWWAQW